MERISINSRAIERKDVEEMNDVKIWPYRILPPFLLPKRMDGRRKSLAGGRWVSLVITSGKLGRPQPVCIEIEERSTELSDAWVRVQWDSDTSDRCEDANIGKDVTAPHNFFFFPTLTHLSSFLSLNPSRWETTSAKSDTNKHWVGDLYCQSASRFITSHLRSRHKSTGKKGN